LKPGVHTHFFFKHVICVTILGSKAKIYDSIFYSLRLGQYSGAAAEKKITTMAASFLA
jgi:hypothetical protein